MLHSRHIGTWCAIALTVVSLSGPRVWTQAPAGPTNSAPNPYKTVEHWAKMPDGRTWGSTSAVDIAKDGKSIWVAERCGQNTCLDTATGTMSPLDPILLFDASGKLIRSFGAGMVIFPHGIHVDRDGNVWVTDGRDNAPPAARGSGGGGGRGADGGRGQRQGRSSPPEGTTKGHQVFKFSPDGKLLLTLGKPGGAGDPEFFYQPNDILVAPDGSIFVAEGHASAPGSHARILKFDRNGKFIKAWGRRGTGPGEFDQPHALAMDSRGRLFVGDRGNDRIQIMDQDGKFIDQWTQFSRPSGIYIDRKDTIYVADSESGSVAPSHGEWKRGIRIGSAKDGRLTAFIPDPDEKPANTSAAEGLAVDAAGNVYGAEVGPRALKKYVR